MQLVIHSSYGSRVNRAWGLALRKRFCRTFNFELQAAATEDHIVLSLTEAHSFELAEVARYLHSNSARQVLIQALCAAPMFGVRWRWDAGIALALPRFRGGKKVPPQIARMNAEDLLASVFPDQVACAENLPGEIEVPDHPLVRQTIRDCLEDAMDIDAFEELLRGLESGAVRVIARDLTEPSPLALEALNARPYAYPRRCAARGAPHAGGDEPALDRSRLGRRSRPARRARRSSGCARRRGRMRRRPTSCTMRLLWLTFLTEEERRANPAWPRSWMSSWPQGRAVRCAPSPGGRALGGGGTARAVRARHALLGGVIDARSCAGRLEGLGPVDSRGHRRFARLAPAPVDCRARGAAEREGFALRGSFTPGAAREEWCERRLLARIHRYTVKRLRAEIEPVRGAGFPALFVRVAAGAAGSADAGPGRGRGRARAARGLRGAGRRVGDRHPALADHRVRAGVAG